MYNVNEILSNLKLYNIFSGSRVDGRRGLDVAGIDQSVTNTETDSLLSSRQDGEDLYDDTESSITSVSQIALGKLM